MGPEQCLDFQRFACLVFFVAASNIVLDSCGIIDGERCVRESAALQDNTDLRYRVESLPHTASQTGGEWQSTGLDRANPSHVAGSFPRLLYSHRLKTVHQHPRYKVPGHIISLT